MANNSIDDLKTRRDLAQESVRLLEELKDSYADLGPFASKLLGIDRDMVSVKDGILTKNKQGIKLTKDQAKEQLKTVKANKQLADSMTDQLGFLKTFRNISKTINTILMANPLLAIATVLIGVITLAVKLNAALSETAKEFGVSRKEAALIEGKLKLAQINGLGLALTAEEIRASFTAIGENLGGIDNATVKMTRNIANAAAISGTTADEFTRILSLQESISDLSREALISQTQQTAELIRQAGVAPSAIFKDIAANAEFFAQYAKDGGNNLIKASVQARKLGLNLSAVADISNNLLDFESSIEKQLEASVLLGRQINLDRARQLAIAGDQEGLLKEVVAQVGGEAEFTRLNVIQRKALADSVGVNVEQLSRLVRNQKGGAAVSATTAALSSTDKLLSDIYGVVHGHTDILQSTATNTRRTDQKIEGP
mgnify:CR=1 FL=1